MASPARVQFLIIYRSTLRALSFIVRYTTAASKVPDQAASGRSSDPHPRVRRLPHDLHIMMASCRTPSCRRAGHESSRGCERAKQPNDSGLATGWGSLGWADLWLCTTAYWAGEPLRPARFTGLLGQWGYAELTVATSGSVSDTEAYSDTEAPHCLRGLIGFYASLLKRRSHAWIYGFGAATHTAPSDFGRTFVLRCHAVRRECINFPGLEGGRLVIMGMRRRSVNPKRLASPVSAESDSRINPRRAVGPLRVRVGFGIGNRPLSAGESAYAIDIAGERACREVLRPVFFRSSCHTPQSSQPGPPPVANPESFGCLPSPQPLDNFVSRHEPGSLASGSSPSMICKSVRQTAQRGCDQNFAQTRLWVRDLTCAQWVSGR